MYRYIDILIGFFFTGIDAFDNIQRQLDAIMNAPAKAEEAVTSPSINDVEEAEVGASAVAQPKTTKSILKST